MYILRYRYSAYHDHPSVMLTEMTKAQFREATKTEDGVYAYAHVNARYAHTWVRNGGLHTTALWVDQGRIRRTRG